jgi:hypothetical protein
MSPPKPQTFCLFKAQGQFVHPDAEKIKQAADVLLHFRLMAGGAGNRERQ